VWNGTRARQTGKADGAVGVLTDLGEDHSVMPASAQAVSTSPVQTSATVW
jgi:hypothetical protein